MEHECGTVSLSWLSASCRSELGIQLGLPFASHAPERAIVGCSLAQSDGRLVGVVHLTQHCEDRDDVARCAAQVVPTSTQIEPGRANDPVPPSYQSMNRCTKSGSSTTRP